jgi:Tol biopolymer transport system component
MVAYRIGERNTLCIWEAALAESRCLPEIGAVYTFDWSPDGTRLVLGQPSSPGSLTVLDIETEQTSVVARWDDRAVLDAVAASGHGEPVAIQFEGPEWSRSARFIATLAMVRTEQGWSGNVVLVFDLSGRVVARGLPFREFSEARGWSPTDDLYAYASGEPPYRIVDAWLLDATTGNPRLLEPTVLGERTIGSLAWSPSGRWVALTLGYEVLIIDTTGADSPRSFRALSPLELVDWGP